MVLSNFAVYFACTRMVRTLRAGLHDFPGAWRRCNYKRRQWNDHCASLCLLCPYPTAYGLGTRAVRLSGMPCTRKTAHSSPFNGGF
ncbi:MAG: hypothetical protein WC091_01520 [Sulfuricellaceae bacterium]